MILVDLLSTRRPRPRGCHPGPGVLEVLLLWVPLIGVIELSKHVARALGWVLECLTGRVPPPWDPGRLLLEPPASSAAVATIPVQSSVVRFVELHERERRRFVTTLSVLFGLGIFLALTVPLWSFYMERLPQLARIAALSLGIGATTGILQGYVLTRHVTARMRDLTTGWKDPGLASPQLAREERLLDVVSVRPCGFFSVWGRTVLTTDAVWFVPGEDNFFWHTTPLRLALDEIEDFELVRDPGGNRAERNRAAAPTVLRITTPDETLVVDVGSMEAAARLVEALEPRLSGADLPEALRAGLLSPA